MCGYNVLLTRRLSCSTLVRETRGHVTRVHLSAVCSVSGHFWRVISWRLGRDVFKLMSQIASHTANLKSPGGQGASWSRARNDRKRNKQLTSGHVSRGHVSPSLVWSNSVFLWAAHCSHTLHPTLNEFLETRYYPIIRGRHSVKRMLKVKQIRLKLNTLVPKDWKYNQKIR
jgi:hypothetical protein